MLEMLKAIKHCYHGMGSCKGCPYENDSEKCKKLFDNIQTVFTKIGEFVEFEDVQNIVNIVLKRGEENNENEN